MRVKLDKSTANTLRSIRSSKGRNIVEIAIEIGEDPATFFEGQDWSGLDLRSCNLSGVSFANAKMDDVQIYDDQLEAIRHSGPASLRDAQIFKRQTTQVSKPRRSYTTTSRNPSALGSSFPSALREAISEAHLRILMREDQHDFFFVDVGDDGPSWNARRLSDDFKVLVAKSHRPRYRTLLNISQGLPVALPNLVKLHACVKSYCNHGSAKYSGALEQDGWKNGLPEKSVVPCLYILDRKRSTSFAKDKNGVPELPKRVFDHIMKDVEDGELGEYLAKNCGSPDGLEVEHSLRNQCIDGTNTREVRVTSKIARGVVDFLNSKNESEKVLELRHVFVWSPARGEGRGRRTSALPLTAGNVLPSVDEAFDYPDAEPLSQLSPETAKLMR